MDVSINALRSVFQLFIIFTMLFLNFACNEKEVVIKPSYILSKDSMVQMLTEVHLIEASLGVRIFEDKKIVNTRDLLKAKIFKNYDVSRDRFVKSYEYYAQQPMVIDSIYTDVISEITKRQAEQIKSN